MNVTSKVVVESLLLTMSTLSYSTPVTLDFEKIAPYPSSFNVQILDFYNGGTSSAGTSGPNFGVSFDSSARLLCLNSLTTGCSNASRGSVGSPTSAQGALGFNTNSPKYVNVASGFTGAISFVYAAVVANGSVDVFDGLNGTGLLLGSIALPANAIGCTAYAADFCPFTAAGLSFAGVARSIGFNAVGIQYTIDDLTFDNIVASVPEPANWTLMLVGFALLGYAMRQRPKQFAGPGPQFTYRLGADIIV